MGTGPEHLDFRSLSERVLDIESDIARRYRLYAELMLEEDLPDGEEEYRNLVQAIRDQARRDREENILFQLWMKERLVKGPIDLEIEEFSEVLVGRALVRLLHYVPKGERLLQSLDPSDSSWIPSRESVRRFVHSGGLAEEDPQVFLARLFSEVPRSRRALYKLLGAYKAVVEVEAEKAGRPVPGELPGERLKTVSRPWTWDEVARLFGFPPTLWEIEIARVRKVYEGLSSYLDGSSLEEAYRQAGEARERFRQRLVRYGILRRVGRPKKEVRDGDAS